MAVTAEYSITTGTLPVGMCLGQDGNIWSVTNVTARIVKVSTTGRITYYTPPTVTRLTDICSDGTGLWATVFSGYQVVQRRTCWWVYRGR